LHVVLPVRQVLPVSRLDRNQGACGAAHERRPTSCRRGGRLMSKTIPGVLGIYSHMDTLIEAIHHFKKTGRKDLKVFSPAPFHQIDHALDEKVSPVRRFTLIGGLTGCTFGYLFTSFTSL